MKEIFQHTKINVPKKSNDIVLSPSTLSVFFEYPSVWFKEQIMKEEPSFIGNTATFIGTCVHYLLEKYAKDREHLIKNFSDICISLDIALDTHINNNLKLMSEIDIDTVKQMYRTVFEVVVNQYLCYESNIPTYTEISLYTKIDDYDIYLAGTIDNITKDTIIDYKTASKLPTTMIPFKYKLQLLSYYYLATRNGYNIKNIGVVYGILPTLRLRARCEKEIIPVNNDDIIMFEKILKLICESIKRCKEDKTLIPLIFKSMELNNYEIPIM